MSIFYPILCFIYFHILYPPNKVRNLLIQIIYAVNKCVLIIDNVNNNQR